MANGNYWLVKTGPGAAEVQNPPSGQKPLQANWGAAVYLGPTISDVNKYLGIAASRLHIPNPQHVPSLSMSLAIIGAEVGGFSTGLARIPLTAGETAVAGGGETAAAGGGASSAITGASTGASLGSIATTLKKVAPYATIGAALADPKFAVRLLEIVGGIVLMFLGIKVLTNSGTPGTITRQAKTIAKVVK